MKVRNLLLIVAWGFIITTWVLWFTPYLVAPMITSILGVAIAVSALFVNPETRI